MTTLFVFGAGATRGASFVNPLDDPCLPPLDGDFFTQLQRVRNSKHRNLIKDVMRDVVDLFGQNFDATMETVFSTLEHTERMIEATGENRDYKKSEIRDKRKRLEQAIAVVLEESLTVSDIAGHSTHERKRCESHNAFVANVLEAGDDIISFNYDCVLEDALKSYGNEKWNPRYGYGFNLGAGGKKLTGDQHWRPDLPAGKESTVHLYKLHGSLHFQITDAKSGHKVNLKQHPYTKRAGNLNFSIIPPEWQKAYDQGAFASLWKQASAAIHRAERLVMVGYSLPPTDLHSTALFRTSLKKAGLKSIVIVNPDSEARKRIRSVIQRGMTKDTKVHSIDYLSHFTAMHTSVWK